MTEDELADILAARPQDLVAALGGVSLRDTIKVVLALQLFAKASENLDLETEAAEFLEACREADKSKMLSLPDEMDRQNCEVALYVVNQNIEFLGMSPKEIKQKWKGGGDGY